MLNKYKKLVEREPVKIYDTSEQIEKDIEELELDIVAFKEFGEDNIEGANRFLKNNMIAKEAYDIYQQEEVSTESLVGGFRKLINVTIAAVKAIWKKILELVDSFLQFLGLREKKIQAAAATFEKPESKLNLLKTNIFNLIGKATGGVAAGASKVASGTAKGAKGIASGAVVVGASGKKAMGDAVNAAKRLFTKLKKNPEVIKDDVEPEVLKRQVTEVIERATEDNSYKEIKPRELMYRIPESEWQWFGFNGNFDVLNPRSLERMEEVVNQLYMSVDNLISVSSGDKLLPKIQAHLAHMNNKAKNPPTTHNSSRNSKTIDYGDVTAEDRSWLTTFLNEIFSTLNNTSNRVNYKGNISANLHFKYKGPPTDLSEVSRTAFRTEDDTHTNVKFTNPIPAIAAALKTNYIPEITTGAKEEDKVEYKPILHEGTQVSNYINKGVKVVSSLRNTEFRLKKLGTEYEKGINNVFTKLNIDNNVPQTGVNKMIVDLLKTFNETIVKIVTDITQIVNSVTKTIENQVEVLSKKCEAETK